jgi:ABC-type transport system substrate-binding protein
VATDAVGAPIFTNRDAAYPVNHVPTDFGFTETLTRWAEVDGVEDNATPWLATSWEVAPDLSKVTFTLREGVQFHAYGRDWGEMTAEDVAWSMNDVTVPESRHDNNAEMAEVFGYSAETPWVAVDKYKVEATLKAHRPDFLTHTVLSNKAGVASVLSKKVFDEMGPAQMLIYPHGTGQFVVRQWLPNERIEAEAVPDHWRRVPDVAELIIIESPEASVRTAMLQTGEVDISLAPIADVPKLEALGFAFHEGLRTYVGHNVIFAGNFWEDTIGETGEPLPPREGFKPDDQHPWIGDPKDPDRMESARQVRWAMSMAIDREAINTTILAGFGGAAYGGRGGVIFHQSHPEWKDRWVIPFDPVEAKRLMVEAGYPDGFETSFLCPSATGLTTEVCLAVAGMWEEHLNLNVKVDTTAYTAARPTMVQRQINMPWVFVSAPNRLASHEPGQFGSTHCCAWARPTQGGWNTGLEVREFYEFELTRYTMDPASPEAFKAREDLNDFANNWMLSTGVVEVPKLVGLNPQRVASWELEPLSYLNGFETVVLKR